MLPPLILCLLATENLAPPSLREGMREMWLSPSFVVLSSLWVLVWVFFLFYIPWSRKKGFHLKYSEFHEHMRLSAIYGGMTLFSLFLIGFYIWLLL
jgi:heme/copper-type cytochrome/quinol oxidase subunit 2